MPQTPFLGQIMWTPYNFAPQGWAFCNGQLLSIVQNTALFSLIGTTYGGDGRTTFGLPDLRGRTPIASGQGPGLSNYNVGDHGGVEGVALTIGQMAQHTHSANCSTARGNSATPTGSTIWAVSSGGDHIYSTGTPNATLGNAAIGAVGGGQPHENRPPFLTLNYCIALVGIFPSRG
jgi:microcystin-dependent protein